MDPANQRKFTAFYWSFAEFGRHALSQDWAWFIGGIFLTSLVREIDGGLSRITSLVLREFFVLSSFCTGTELDLGFRRERFFFRYMCMIGDEDALRASWAFKGSSGNRICFKCKNCVRKGAELPDGEYLKTTTARLSLCLTRRQTLTYITAQMCFAKRHARPPQRPASKSWRWGSDSRTL